MRFKTYWLHSFFLFALVWSFGVALKDEYKEEFELWLKKQATIKGFTERLTAKKSSGPLGSKRLTGLSGMKSKRAASSASSDSSGGSMASY